MNIKRAIPPACQAVPASLPGRRKKTIELQVKVITALYGGGVIAGEKDPLTPFRPTSIRGHLRFWWRATVGGQYPTWEKLLNAESQVWGSTERASAVVVEVVKAQAGRPVRAVRRNDQTHKPEYYEPRYALFPAQEALDDVGTIYEDGSFSLRMTFDERAAGEDVDAALHAWFKFGGVGARTRRGAGALYCEQYQGIWNPQIFRGDGMGKPWPTLRGARVVLGDRSGEPRACWKQAVDLLKLMRQDRTGKFGRSRWPEPDEIRRLRGQSLPHHAPVNPVREFPRGAFGMPIVFHFKDTDSGDTRDRDPLQNTLVPAASQERMASPVILKPIAFSARDVRPILLALNVEGAPASLVLQQKGKPDLPVVRGNRPVIDELIHKARAFPGTEYPL